MTASLTSGDADRPAKLCGLFSSDHDGERASAAAKADALIRARGLTWHDVIILPQQAASNDWQKMAAFCQAHHQQLNAKGT